MKRALRSVYVNRNPADSQPSPATPPASEAERQWFLLDTRTQHSRCESLTFDLPGNLQHPCRTPAMPSHAPNYAFLMCHSV